MEAWRRQLDEPVSAFPVTKAGPAHIATLKTFDPPVAALEGRQFRGTERRGKRLLFPTDDGELADAVRRMRHHGIEPRGGFEIAHAGLNYRLSDILCAVGIPQLARLGELLEARTRIAAGYAERLGSIVETPSADEGDVHGWQAYVIQVDGAADKIAALREQRIEAQVGTYALHQLAAYRDQGDFPGASRVFDRAVALPFHTRLTESDLDRVAEALTSQVSK